MSKTITVNGEEISGCLTEDQSGGLSRATKPEIKEVGKLALEETVQSVNAAGDTATTKLAGGQYPDFYADQYIQSVNFTRGGNSGKVLVIHTMQGSYGSAVSWFQNRSAQVSAHYCVGYNGESTQMVSEYDTAWHVGYSNNYCIGIEHAGYIDDGYPPTDACYQTSAKLAAGIKRRHPGIVIVFSNQYGLTGHINLPRQTHTDPGHEWDWKRYLALVDHYYSNGSQPSPVPTPSPTPVQTKVQWINLAETTDWGNQRANAAKTALVDNGFKKVGVTENVAKAAQDSTDGITGNTPTIVFGATSWALVPDNIRNGVEGSIKMKRPYEWDVWYANSEKEVRWRLSNAAILCGLDKTKVLNQYEAELKKA